MCLNYYYHTDLQSKKEHSAPLPQKKVFIVTLTTSHIRKNLKGSLSSYLTFTELTHN